MKKLTLATESLKVLQRPEDLRQVQGAAKASGLFCPPRFTHQLCGTPLPA